MKRRAGLTLLSVLAFVALVGTLGILTHELATATRGRLDAHRQAQSAAAMADMGLDYARYMLRRGRWQGLRRFDSPDLGDSQRFTLEVLPENARTFRVVCTGQAGAAVVRREVRLP